MVDEGNMLTRFGPEGLAALYDKNPRKFASDFLQNKYLPINFVSSFRIKIDLSL